MLLSGSLSSGRGGRKKALVRPAGKTMDRRIESFPISISCRDRLSSCNSSKQENDYATKAMQV